MKLNIIHIAASRFFNLAISTSIIGAMLSLTLLSISQVRSQVEVFMMEADVANLRWELRELWTHRNATGQSFVISEIENTNPLRLVNEGLPNYSGEYTQPPLDVQSIWYFDIKKLRLIYVFRDGHQVRYRLSGTAQLNRASLGAVGSIDLVLD
ncbi:MAG: hypothetical protein D0530_08495 [Methylococcales bacterium]|nr:MAG: hypothetical protein D0530_08495 [Methylococcales bacterium]